LKLPFILLWLFFGAKVGTCSESSILPFCAAAASQTPSALIGSSPSIFKLREQIHRVAATDALIFLVGESGSGKEVVAREILRLSKRRDKPFIAKNMSTIPPSLAESELFGHEKGAFTGAIARMGIFEEAHEGTLFLDEITELDISLQAKLLRALEEREITPLAGKTRQIDTRIIAATNRDPLKAVEEKALRRDLFYRLNVITLTVPPLRDRKSDIPELVQFFADKYSNNYGRKTFSPEALAFMATYDWPGNIRELRNAVEYALIFSGDASVVRAPHLPEFIPGVTEFLSSLPPAVPPRIAPPPEIDADFPTFDELQRRYMLKVLERTGGNREEASVILDMPLRTLYRRLDEWKIPPTTKPNAP